VRFINGEYQQQIFDEHRGEITNETYPYYEVARHWQPMKDRKGKPHICSAGVNDLKPRPCVGCELKLNKSYSRVLTVVNLSWYHKIPWTDADGNLKKKRDGTTIMVDRECEGRNCKMCASGDERFFGRREHFTMNMEHFTQLLAKTEELNSNCKCGGVIEYYKFLCSSCEKPLIDVDDDNCDLTDDEIRTAMQKGYYCDDCNFHTDIIPLPECPDCENPRPVTLFDVEVTLKKIMLPGTQNKSTLDISFSAPKDWPEDYEGEKTPMDLKSIFAPKPIKDQREDYNYHGEISNMTSSEDGETEEYA
jgi:hypothetical protein